MNFRGEGIAAMTESADSNAGKSLDPLERVMAVWGWLQRELWAHDPKAPIFVRALRSAAQLVTLTIKGFQDDQLLFRCHRVYTITYGSAHRCLSLSCRLDARRVRLQDQ